MDKLAAFLVSAFLLTSVPTVAGCGSQQYDPNYWHQNFVAHLQNQVGTKLGNYLSERKYTASSLPNGNMAYKVFRGGTCYSILEVDLKTDIIVAATWEGEARHCIIIP